MTNNIVPKLTPEELLDLFRREAKILVDGKVEFSRRGVARLTGKDKVQIQRLLRKCSGDMTNGSAPSQPLSKPLLPFAGVVFSGGDNLSDTVVSALVSHFSRLGCDHCADLLDLFTTIGLRASVHQAQCWTTNRTESDHIKLQYLLESPRKWSAQFPDEYYEHLARLTGQPINGTKRPHYWAQLTNKFAYHYLPSEIEDGVRRAKLANATNDKLHQFLKPDGLELLQTHLNALIVLMSGASSIEALRQSTIGRFSGKYQLALKLN